MTVDPDELWEALTIYHREFFLPDLERMFDAAEMRLTSGADGLDATETLLTTRFHGFDAHFAEMHRRFDRLDALSQMALATVKRIEERLDRITNKPSP
jgi:hypothetical protein